ncbi:MAG: glutamate-cysteine ligase family protein [Eggerthellaceae bacterium]|jgi:glutamate--cysteine ligase|nr:glutamate-cysteine ligase family protein [Eggerthellaceae bacterium]MDR2722005.1 hypothetical protein [Coriobacteriaceae bacterium]
MKKTTITDQPARTEQPARADQPAHTDQPARGKNIAALVAYFKSGITEGEGALGIELEHTIVKQQDASPVSYTETKGIRWLLEQLHHDYPEAIYDAEGDILGVSRPGEAITLEPAAQIELSAGPFTSLTDAKAVFEAFEQKLAALLEGVGQRVLLVGYHPTAAAADLELIPKRRYKFMNFYLSEIGPFGPAMMRGSASTQISIDYHSIDDCLRKLRLAFALVPIFSLITDNAAIFEGQVRPHRLMRTKIWLECDPDRCGLVPGVMDGDFTLERYAEYILDTPAILVPCKTQEWCYSDKTFGERYAQTPMERADVEHALSLFFNDVRLKTYIEIRPADAMPLPFVLAYAALIKGLFYSEASLNALDALFANVDEGAINKAKHALMNHGYEAKVYGRNVAEIADAVMMIASKSLSLEERAYLEPLDTLVFQRKTLADTPNEQ